MICFTIILLRWTFISMGALKTDISKTACATHWYQVAFVGFVKPETSFPVHVSGTATLVHNEIVENIRFLFKKFLNFITKFFNTNGLEKYLSFWFLKLTDQYYFLLFYNCKMSTHLAALFFNV